MQTVYKQPILLWRYTCV